MTSTTLSHRGGKLFIVTSALKSQRRVRCEFGVENQIKERRIPNVLSLAYVQDDKRAG